MQNNAQASARAASVPHPEHATSMPDQIGQLLGRSTATAQPALIHTVAVDAATVREIKEWMKENEDSRLEGFKAGKKNKRKLVEGLLERGITKLEFQGGSFSSTRKEKRQQRNEAHFGTEEDDDEGEEEPWNLIKSNQWIITDNYRSSHLPPFERMMAKFMICPHCKKDRREPVCAHSGDIAAPMPVQLPAVSSPPPPPSHSPSPPPPSQATNQRSQKKRKHAPIGSRVVDVSLDTCDGMITIHADQTTGQGTWRREKNGTVEAKTFQVPKQPPATPVSDTWIRRYRQWYYVETENASFPPMVIWAALWSYAKEDVVIKRLWTTYRHVISNTKTLVDHINRLGLEIFHIKAKDSNLGDLIDMNQAENRALELVDARRLIQETIGNFENAQMFWENYVAKYRQGPPTDEQIKAAGRAIRKELGVELVLKPRRSFGEDNPSDVDSD